MSTAGARDYAAAEKLKGGTPVSVRAIRPDDRSRLGEAFAKLEPGAGSGAEVAFTVEEDFQGQGIAGLLLRHLARIARRQGVRS